MNLSNSYFFVKRQQGLKPIWDRIDTWIRKVKGRDYSTTKATLGEFAEFLRQDAERLQKLADEWPDEPNP